MSYKLTRKKIEPLDPYCKKTAYNSQAEAEDMAEYLKEEKGLKVRVYQCVVCKLWHLTSN